jgi:hypothetical protein
MERASASRLHRAQPRIRAGVGLLETSGAANPVRRPSRLARTTSAHFPHTGPLDCRSPQHRLGRRPRRRHPHRRDRPAPARDPGPHESRRPKPSERCSKHGTRNSPDPVRTSPILRALMEAPVLDAAAKRLSVDQFDLSEEAPAARLLYHVAPRFCRASIECHGLDSSLDTMPGLAGTYLWQNVEQARTYAAPLNVRRALERRDLDRRLRGVSLSSLAGPAHLAKENAGRLTRSSPRG